LETFLSSSAQDWQRDTNPTHETNPYLHGGISDDPNQKDRSYRPVDSSSTGARIASISGASSSEVLPANKSRSRQNLLQQLKMILS
jgi:hypothetical protein